MKKLAFMAMAALAMVACQNNENAYTISGTFEGAGENDSVSLHLIEGRKLVDLQKVAIVNGKFEFKGVADTVQVAAITMGEAFCQFFLEPGDIKVDMKLGQMVYALGTPNNNAYESYMNDMKALEDEYAEISRSAQSAELTDAQREKLTARLEARTGKKIELTCAVVPGLIGGIRLSFDNRLIDDTAHTKLKTIAGSLADAVL